MIPSVFVTAAHHHAGLKRDAASVWIEDVTKSSFKICLRELQNYAGSHEDVYVVSVSASIVQDVTEPSYLYSFSMFSISTDAL